MRTKSFLATAITFSLSGKPSIMAKKRCEDKNLTFLHPSDSGPSFRVLGQDQIFGQGFPELKIWETRATSRQRGANKCGKKACQGRVLMVLASSPTMSQLEPFPKYPTTFSQIFFRQTSLWRNRFTDKKEKIIENICFIGIGISPLSPQGPTFFLLSDQMVRKLSVPFAKVPYGLTEKVEFLPPSKTISFPPGGYLESFGPRYFLNFFGNFLPVMACFQKLPVTQDNYPRKGACSQFLPTQGCLKLLGSVYPFFRGSNIVH